MKRIDILRSTCFASCAVEDGGLRGQKVSLLQTEPSAQTLVCLEIILKGRLGAVEDQEKQQNRQARETQDGRDPTNLVEKAIVAQYE